MKYFKTLSAKLRRSTQKQSGFTLIELLIVLAIIGTLTTFAMANILSARERGRDVERKDGLKQLQYALEVYRSDQGTYPPTPLPGCGAPLTSGGTTYLPKVPCDPSSKAPYSYTTNGSTYSIVACLENENDQKKDATKNTLACGSNASISSYTVTNP